jgi:hypothetical protein
MRAVAVLTVLLMTLGGTADSAELKSFLPKDGLTRFIVEKFDLASIDSIVGPRLEPNKHTFPAMGFKVRKLTATEIDLADKLAHIHIRILSRGDKNHDGLEDVLICFADETIGDGTYQTRTPYQLTRYSADTPLIAIAAEAYSEDCEPYPALKDR